MLARRIPFRDGAVVVVAPLSASLAGFSRAGGSSSGLTEATPRAWSATPPPETPTAEMRLKEVTSAPKRVSTSASVLPKSGW